jgi:hypothetical protein
MTRCRYEIEARPLDLGGGYGCDCSKMEKKSEEGSSRSMSTRKPSERKPERWLTPMPKTKGWIGWRLAKKHDRPFKTLM